MYIHIAAFLTLVAATSCYFEPQDALYRQEILRWRNLTRLPQSPRPSAYHLKMFPRIDDGYFNGSVLIKITCHESTNTVILHAHEVLNIHQVNISNQGQGIEITNVSRNGSDDTMTLVLANPIQSNTESQLQMLFSGEIRDVGMNYKIRGLFTDKEITSYVSTANSPISAREVFPCFDEPSFKATFQLSVARLSNMTSLSVMPRAATEPAGVEGYEWDHFPPTPPLSTCSMNFMVHQFNKTNCINVPAKQGNISVYIHYQERIPGDSYINIEGSILASLINYLDSYLGIEYPLPKLDIVKLPQLQVTDQGSTLGLVILSDIDADSGRPQLARELANQWLNHIVTPQWWNDFILTDMLGNFLLNYIFDEIQPKWTRYMMDRTTLYELQKYSWYHDQRRWNPYVVWTDEWFLHMLNNSLTGSTVQKGIRNLYSEKQFKSFSGRELWDAINRQARMDGTLADSPTVEKIANSWLGRQAPHFPTVTVTRNYENGSALLEQHLFRGGSHNATQEELDFMWWIPIAYLTPDKLDVDSMHTTSWMGGRTHNIGNLPDMQSFVIMNPVDAGMFLVNYDEHNWGLISRNLQSSECKIPKMTHKKLLQDALLLSNGRELNIGTTFNLTLSLCNETDLSVWDPFIDSLLFMQSDFEFTAVEEKFQTYLRRLLGSTLERNDRTSYTWQKIRALLTSVGYQPYIDAVSAYMNNTVPIFPLLDNDTGLILYCPEFMKNTSDDWESYLHKLEFVGAINVFWKYLSKCPGYTDLIEKILNGVANEGSTWKPSTWNGIRGLLTRSRTAHNMTLNFLVENVDQLVEKYRESDKEYDMTNLVRFVFEKIKSEEQFNKGKDFLEKYQNVSETTKYDVNNSNLYKKNLFDRLQEQVPDLEKWLDQNLPTFKC